MALWTSKRAAELPSPDEVAAAWRVAQDVWGVEVTLSPPDSYAEYRSRKDTDEPLAYIDLVRRQVVVNFEYLQKLQALNCLPAVLAHELGHHVRFPHTLGLSAALELLQHRLIPEARESLTNLFFDLLVNEVVGRTRRAEIIQIYQGFSRPAPEDVSSLYAFYLAIYEELWGLGAGELTSDKAAANLEVNYPGTRAEARMFAQTFYALTDVYLQFVYFCSRIIRYLPKPDEAKGALMPMTGDVSVPDIDDYAGALEGSSAVDQALDEAADRGWINEEEGKAGSDPLTAAAVLASRQPGKQATPFLRALADRIYQRLVERNLVRLPEESARPPDPFLPTTLETWEPGENPRTIDWTASVLASGLLAPLNLLRRELESDVPAEAGKGGIELEIYLDTSGSMPNPITATNAMTLAAQILSASAIRRLGRVKAIIYSGSFICSEWMQNEAVARDYLLNYAGGGTVFPFKKLAELARERAGVGRVLISDSDFLHNVTQGKLKAEPTSEMKTLLQAIPRSRLFVALLAIRDIQSKAAKEILAPALKLPAFRLAMVSDPSKLPLAAAELSRAIWGK